MDETGQHGENHRSASDRHTLPQYVVSSTPCHGKSMKLKFGLETLMIVFSSFNLPCLSMVNHGFNFNLFTFGSNIRKDLFQIRLLLAINRCENVY